MASLGHIAIGFASARFVTQEDTKRMWLKRAVVFSLLAYLPDIDVIGYLMGIPYESLFGHRGITHSIGFAFIAACFAVPMTTWLKLSKLYLWLVVFGLVLSHGLIDAMTSGGHGVALFWPLTAKRVFFYWRPIPVSALGVSVFSVFQLKVLAIESLLFLPLFLYSVLGIRCPQHRANAQSLAAWIKASPAERSIHLVAKATCLVLVMYFGWKTIPKLAHTQDVRIALIFFSQIALLLVILRARFSPDVDRMPLILLATAYSAGHPLFLDFERGAALLPASVTILVQVFGLSVQLLAIFWLGRSFGLLPARRGLVQTGPYAWVRHPIYAGFILNHAGFLLSHLTLSNLLLSLTLLMALGYRIYREERWFREVDDYKDYAARVQYRLIPGLL